MSATSTAALGSLTFTVDQGQHTERYQGVVPLEGATLGQFAFDDEAEGRLLYVMRPLWDDLVEAREVARRRLHDPLQEVAHLDRDVADLGLELVLQPEQFVDDADLGDEPAVEAIVQRLVR